MSSVINDSMTQDYCINKAATEGSNLYYATLFEKEKALIISLYALLSELMDIIHECSDPGIARIKLKWWQTELEHLSNKQPSHPVTRELSKNIDFNEKLLTHLKQLVENIESFLLIEQPDSLDSCLAIYRNANGKLWYQCALQLGCAEKTTLNLICEMGACYHFLVCLQQPNIYINESRCIIPAAYIMQTDLFELKMNRSRNKTIQTECFTPLLLALKTRLDKTYRTLPEKDQFTLQYALILNRLATKICENILSDGCHLLDKKINLLPIGKLWIAWRTHVSIASFNQL